MFGGRQQTLYLLGVPYLLTLILVGGDLRAQDASTGALRGTVMDAQGAAIAAADIVAIDTGIRYHSATDSEGRFKLDLLPPGEYSARAEAEGMLPQNSPSIRRLRRISLRPKCSREASAWSGRSRTGLRSESHICMCMERT